MMSAPVSTGFLGSLQQLGERLLTALHSRVELLSLEVHEEKFRLVQYFIWINALFFVGALALVFASLTLVCAFWESARLAALGGLTLLYAGTFVGLIVVFRRRLARQPRPLADTLQELGADRACFRTKN